MKDSDKQKIINLISALRPHARIYLFGSQARGTAVHGSDVDIALDEGTKIERVEVGEVRDVLSATNMSYKIDVVDLHGISKEMRAIILKEGIIWKS